MARKTATVVIDADGRDHGKTFLLRELPASQGEKWGIKAIHGLSRAGVDVSEFMGGSGLAGLAVIGMHAIFALPWSELEPLLDEMMTCATVIPDPARPNVTRALIDDDIEEIATLVRLRKEVFDLHTGFFANAARSTSEAATAAP